MKLWGRRPDLGREGPTQLLFFWMADEDIWGDLWGVDPWDLWPDYDGRTNFAVLPLDPPRG